MSETGIHIYRRGTKESIFYADRAKSTWDAVDMAVEKGVSLKDACLRGINLLGMGFNGADLEGADFRGANLAGTTFVGANLRGADFRGRDLHGVRFAKADLSGADFGICFLYAANFLGANLSGASLGAADLTRANLREADLSGADLRGAKLWMADLSRADLSGADLARAELSKADFSEANLTRARIAEATLKGTILWRADLSEVDLREAYIEDAKEDLYEILEHAEEEVPELLDALRGGRIDGGTYYGECACLVGTIASLRGCSIYALHKIDPDSKRPAETWFVGIRPGDTPENSQISAITVEWIEEWLNEG